MIVNDEPGPVEGKAVLRCSTVCRCMWILPGAEKQYASRGPGAGLACLFWYFFFNYIKVITAFVHPSDLGLLPKSLGSKVFVVLSIISPLTRLVNPGVFTAVALGCPSQRHGCRSGSLVWLFSSTILQLIWRCQPHWNPSTVEPSWPATISIGYCKSWQGSLKLSRDIGQTHKIFVPSIAAHEQVHV